MDFDNEGKIKLVTVLADAPLHKDSSSDTFSAPGSASDENLGKLLDRKLDEGNSRLLVTGRLAQDETGKVWPDRTQTSPLPTTIMVIGPAIETDKVDGKSADKANILPADDAEMKPSIDPIVYNKLDTGTIAFSGPKTLANDWAFVKGEDVTVDLTGKLVTEKDLGLDKRRVKVRGAVVDDNGKVVFDDCGNLKIATVEVEANIHDFDDKNGEMNPGTSDDIEIEKLLSKGVKDKDKTALVVTGDQVDVENSEKSDKPLRVMVLGPLLDKEDEVSKTPDTKASQSVKAGPKHTEVRNNVKGKVK